MATNKYSKNPATTAAQIAAAKTAQGLASAKPSDRALAQEEMFQTAADIAALDAVKTGNFDNITRGSDSYSENAQKIRAAERLDTFLRTDPNDFKGKFSERQDQINEQKRILDRLEKYGYSLNDDDGVDTSPAPAPEPPTPTPTPTPTPEEPGPGPGLPPPAPTPEPPAPTPEPPAPTPEPPAPGLAPPADPGLPGPTGPQAGGDFIPTVPATEVLELEADEVAPINPSVPQTVVQKVAPVTYQSDPSSGPAPVISGSTTQAPATGTFSTPLQTAGLSAVPQQVTYKTHYAGTAGAVPQTLVTTDPGSGEQYTSGYRSVYYVNDLGQRMLVTEFNGRPTTYVPPGFYREGSKKASTDATTPTSGSQGDPNVQVQLPRNPDNVPYPYSTIAMSEGGDVTLARRFLGFDGPPQQLDNFLQANPAAAARMGKYRQAMTNMGGIRMGAAEGTVVSPLAQMTSNLVSQTMQPIQSPTGMIQPSAADFIPVDAGMTTPIAPFAEAATVGNVQQALMPTQTPVVKAPVDSVAPDIATETAKLTAQQGEIREGAKITAEEQDESSVSKLKAAQGEAIEVDGPEARKLQTDPVTGESEIISGVANAQTAAAFSEAKQHAEATPSKQATVAGQLEGLMAQFEGGNTPAWASGSMRAAMATLSARGLGASSLAGQAVIQAAMESALPIAQMDAQTQAQFEAQNLSNRQQRAMLAAQQRATFIGQEFDQAFQARVQNASRIADIANMNFTAEQQIALEDARAANTMELSNLSNRQAIVMAEAAALSQLDMANLSNRQQTAVQNAQNFLQMDMTNLSNRQQTEMFKSQQNIQALFTDAAAENAFAQFNAANENQVNQFFASLSNQTSQFNATQQNAMDQFNVNSINSLREFNSGLQQQRDLFNAQNGLVIAQANAQWRQNIATINNATQNESNMAFAQTINALTATNLDAIWQRERDILSMAFQVSEGNADRANSIILQKMAADASIDVAELQAKIQAAGQEGNFLSDIFTTIIGLG